MKDDLMELVERAKEIVSMKEAQMSLLKIELDRAKLELSVIESYVKSDKDIIL